MTRWIVVVLFHLFTRVFYVLNPDAEAEAIADVVDALR
jgi:hypothetical protein